MLPNVGMELKARKNISANNDQGSMKHEQKQFPDSKAAIKAVTWHGVC